MNNDKNFQTELDAKKLTREMRKKLIDDYLKSCKRLILLDYDGTLIPFASKPKEAKPDIELIKLLRVLTREPRNEVIIISGRGKGTLDMWLDRFDVGLTAEHGAWVKDKGCTWEIIKPLRNDWKKELRPILESCADKTPGSFVEEKEFSLAWHYRMADTELSATNGRDLKDALLKLVASLDLGVLEGNKIIEVKNAGIDKGIAASHWLSKEKWDFILAIGDDMTDEDTFAALPESAYTIKVGSGSSKARFNLNSAMDVRSLLKELLGPQYA
ncbi:MAG: trehalose-phosphatase [Candidatus Freyarchaeum deiterrae]